MNYLFDVHELFIKFVSMDYSYHSLYLIHDHLLSHDTNSQWIHVLAHGPHGSLGPWGTKKLPPSRNWLGPSGDLRASYGNNVIFHSYIAACGWFTIPSNLLGAFLELGLKLSQKWHFYQGPQWVLGCPTNCDLLWNLGVWWMFNFGGNLDWTTILKTIFIDVKLPSIICWRAMKLP